MGVDKGYGSGKPRSAANSRARQRAASGNFTKGPTQANRIIKKMVAKHPVTGFIGGGVLASKGFVQAAANLSSAVVKRTMINQVKTVLSGKAQNMALVDERTGNSPFMNSAIQNARRELVATTGAGKTYTGMRSLSANIGREMAKDVKKIDISMKALGPTHPLTRADVLAWHRKRDLATALKQESRKALATKRTPK
jgi:hypothetical protein